MWPERVALKDHSGISLVGRKVGHILVIKENAATGGVYETGNHSQKCGLAAARGAKQEKEIARLDAKIDSIDSSGATELFDDALDADARHIHMTIAGKKKVAYRPLIHDHGNMSTMTNPGQLERLQQWRNRPPRAKSIGDGIASMDRKARLLHRRVGEFVNAWHTLLPTELHERTCVTGIRGGVVDVVVESSAVSFEIDRRLREGLLDEIRAVCRGTVVRVKLRIGALCGVLADER